MELPFTVRELDLTDAQLAEPAWRIQLAAHQVEADWLAYPALPVLWPTLNDAMACRQRVLGAFEGTDLRGVLVVSERPEGGWHIERTVVDPQHFHAGWGYRLLNALLADADEVTVDTGAANSAALGLYHKAGFEPEQRWHGPDGLVLWRLHYRRPTTLPSLTLLPDGWIQQARCVPSPNCDERSEGVQPELLVIHNISLPPYRYGGKGVEQLFTNRLNPAEHPFYATIDGLRVSSHFFIRRNGELVQCVSVHRRAWHAGVSRWQGRERCNDFSIGVELEGCDFEPFSAAQYGMLTALANTLKAALPLRAMTGHEHIAPGRKTDPGPFFDWPRARRGIDLPG